MGTRTVDLQMRAAQERHDQILRELGAPAPGIAGVRQQAARAREWWNEGGPELADVQDAQLPGPYREIPVRIYVPEQTATLQPAYVYLHGGGWRIGSPGSNDRQLRELAHAWGGIVISTDYAHMPEQTFPAPVDEAAAVYAWLARHGAQWGIDGHRLAFGGSSAGANVALGGFQACGEAQRAMRCAAFIAGVFDDDLDTPSMRDFGHADVFPSREAARAMFHEYVGVGGNRTDPRFNALEADATRLPPLFLAAAECDAFRDSSAAFAAHAARAGRSVELRIYPGVTHLFFGYSRMVEQASECIGDMARFLRTHLPPEGGCA